MELQTMSNLPKDLQCIHRSGCPKPDVCQQVGHCTSMTDEDLHASDCATNNAPALQPGPCDCWLDPTPEMLQDPRFEAIWQTIKSWDINVPHAYHGYCGATGNHVRAILDALENATPGATLRGEDSVPFSAESSRPRELLTSNEYLGKDRDELREIIAERDEEIVRLTREQDDTRLLLHAALGAKNLVLEERDQLNEHCRQLSAQHHEALDQVERLRADAESWQKSAETICEAKNIQIERLRARNVELEGALEQKIEDRTEVIRLRAALVSAQECISHQDFMRVRRVVLAALSGEPPSPVETSPELAARLLDLSSKFPRTSLEASDLREAAQAIHCLTGSSPETSSAPSSASRQRALRGHGDSGQTTTGADLSEKASERLSIDPTVHIHEWHQHPEGLMCVTCGRTRVEVNGKGES